MIDTVDCVVVGAGVVGLAVARVLAMKGREVMVLEAADAIGTGTSSRNSEVIHAGLYYPAGSLKARLCVRGKELLYAYCAERGVPHRRCGKLLVATSAAQLDSLEGIQARARANGVLDLQRLSREEALEMEPALGCVTHDGSQLLGAARGRHLGRVAGLVARPVGPRPRRRGRPGGHPKFLPSPR